MAAGDQRFDDAEGDHGQQAEDEQIGRDKKDAAGFAHAPEIDQRDDNQDCQAYSQRMLSAARASAEISAPTPAEMPTAAVRT